jgi:hypothetical protein
MILLGAAAVLIATHQSRGRRDFLAVLIPLALLEPAAILLFHQSVQQVVEVVDICMLALVIGLAAIYLAQRPNARIALVDPGPGLPLNREPAIEAVS